MLNRFDFLTAFQLSNEAAEGLRAEARKDFVAMFPVQARIYERTRRHILEGALREQAMLKHWKSKQSYIEVPENVIPSISTVPGGGWYAKVS